MSCFVNFDYRNCYVTSWILYSIEDSINLMLKSNQQSNSQTESRCWSTWAVNWTHVWTKIILFISFSIFYLLVAINKFYRWKMHCIPLTLKCMIFFHFFLSNSICTLNSAYSRIISILLTSICAWTDFILKVMLNHNKYGLKSNEFSFLRILWWINIFYKFVASFIANKNIPLEMLSKLNVVMLQRKNKLYIETGWSKFYVIFKSKQINSLKYIMLKQQIAYFYILMKKT